MAFYENEDDKQLDPNAPQEKTTGEGSTVISGQGATPVQAAQAAETTQPDGAVGGATSANPSGSFVGIQQYIKANQPQSSKLAETVGGYVQGQGQQAQQSLKDAQDKYNAQVQANTVNLNQDLLNQAKDKAETVASDEAKKAEFQRMRDANYQGPTSLQATDLYNPVAQAISKAQQSAALTQDEAGQKQLLGQIKGEQGRKINKGALAFDTALLQADPNAKGILEQSRQAISPLQAQLEAAQAQSLTDAQKAAQATQASKDAVAQAFTGDKSVQKTLEQSLLDKATSAQNQSKQQAEATINALKQGAQLTDDQLKLLGVSRADWNAMVGDRDYYKSKWGKTNLDNLAGYGQVVNPAVGITAQNIASAEDYARYQALNDLMGVKNQFLSDPSQAGKANLDALDFNASGLRGDIDSSISLSKQADAQAQAEREAAARRQAEADARAAEERATLTGAAVGFAVAGPVGAVVGAALCLEKGTLIKMVDGSYKKIEDIKLLDETYVGGKVLAMGFALCEEVVDYKGVKMSPSHALFTGSEWVRAGMVCSIEKLETPTIVCPVVTENHVLVSNNGVLFADFAETDQGTSITDEERLKILNSPENLNKTIKMIRENF